MRFRPALFLAAAALAAGVHAQDHRAGGLHVMHPNTPVPGAGQDVIGVYLVIENASGAPDRLLSVRSEVAREAVLHVPAVAGAGMHAAEGLAVLPNARTELSAGGPHIMLSGLERPLTAGERFPLRLVFERAGAVQVEVVVAAPRPGKAHAAHGAH